MEIDEKPEYDLLYIDDDDLDYEQLKEKKRQMNLKKMAEAREEKRKAKEIAEQSLKEEEKKNLRTK